MKEFKKTIIQKAFSDWEKFRREQREIITNEDGYYKKSLKNSMIERVNEFKKRIEENKNLSDDDKKGLISQIKNLSNNNTQIYQDLFILENLFRKHFKNKNIDENYFQNSKFFIFINITTVIQNY